MKSTTMRVRRVLPIAIISILAITIGIITAVNIKSISNRASASITTVEVKVLGESIPPNITGYSPKSGPTTGGTLITFTGTNLENITEITVGGAECKPINIITPEEITCTTTAHVEGEVNIVLTSGPDTVTLPDAFEYIKQPIIPIPPDTGDEGEGGIVAPDTGMFLLGSSDSFTYLDYILVSFIVVAILGVVLYRMCIFAKRKRTTKPTSKRKVVKKSKSRK